MKYRRPLDQIAMWTFAKWRVEFRGHSFVLLFLCSARCEISVEISQRSTPVSNQLQRPHEIRPNFFKRGGPGHESMAPRPGIFRMPAYLAKVHQLPATGCFSCPLVPTPDLGRALTKAESIAIGVTVSQKSTYFGGSIRVDRRWPRRLY
jgi:hypothetical protein